MKHTTDIIPENVIVECCCSHCGASTFWSLDQLADDDVMLCEPCLQHGDHWRLDVCGVKVYRPTATKIKYDNFVTQHITTEKEEQMEEKTNSGQCVCTLTEAPPEPERPKERYAFYEIGYAGVDPARNKDFPPIVTICLLIDSKQSMHRGIAILSPLDTHSDAGKAQALAMARRAAGTNESSEPVTTIGAWRELHRAGVFETFNIAMVQNARKMLYRSQANTYPMAMAEHRIVRAMCHRYTNGEYPGIDTSGKES